jgi:hypothetical protein
MIQELIKELNAIGGHEDEQWLNLLSATWEGHNLKLAFVVKDLSENIIVSNWLVECNDVISYIISDAHGGGLNYHDDDHPAIKQFTDLQVMLHFNGKPKLASKVIAELWVAHRKLVDDWISFETYVNNSDKLFELIEDGYGLLASGPKFLIGEYESVLNKNSIETSRTNERPYKRWIDGQFEIIDKPLAMIHFGESFVVAKNFEAKRAGDT